MTSYAFIGNCQVQSLFHLYRQYVEPRAGDVFRYIRSYEDIAEADRGFIATADVVVEQVQDFRPKGDIAGIETVGRRIFVPVVNGGFLWPYAGQPHPLNQGTWFLDGGPFGSEASDAFLNRMINRKVAPDEAVARYAATDVNKTMNLDRLLELSLEKQRARDALTGFAIADIIETYFRDEPVFRTPYHPNVRVAKALATQFFAQMGVSADDTARMQRGMVVTPFPKEELPLHPSVIRHFGLRYADDVTRYQFLFEGSYSFIEYADRYMRYDWNAPLQEGVALSRNGAVAEGLGLIRQGLELSPRSAPGHAALGHVLHRLGEHEQAIAALRQSLAIDPANAHVHSGLAGVFNHLNRRDAAEESLRTAITLDPYEAHFPTLLSHWLRAWRRVDDAVTMARQAVDAAPYAPAGLVELGHGLDLQGHAGEAALLFRKAIGYAPDNVGALTALASLLSRTGQWSDAVDGWKAVVALEPGNGHAQQHLVHALHKSGNLPAAIAMIEEGLAQTPRDVPLLQRYAACLVQDQRPSDALIVLRTATLIEPGNALLCQDLAQLCRETGDLAGAEAALRQMAAISPAAPAPMAQLAHLFAWQRRWPEARAAADRALSLGGNEADLQALLASVHQETGDSEAAAAALGRAAVLAPGNGDLQYRLSKVWEKLGRMEDAVTAARAAVAIDAGNPHWQTNLGHMLAALGDLDAAEAALRAAVAASPDSAGFHAALADLLLRRGRYDAAVAESRRAVEAAPDNAHFAGRLTYMLEQHRHAASLPSAVTEAAPVVLAPATASLADARAMMQQARRLHREGELGAARDVLLQAAALAPMDGDVRYTLSHVLGALGEHAEALDCARQAVALEPENAHWLNHLGILLMEDCAFEEAETLMQAAIAHAPEGAGFHDSLADLLARQGRLEEATASVEAAISLDPGNVHFRLRLARLLDSAGNGEGAVAALREAQAMVPDNAHVRSLVAGMSAQREAQEAAA